MSKLQEPEKVWDMVVVGGGATGLGVAVDAATRGYSVVLLEMVDFAKSTSSRSTKLVHGGVRYLQKGDVALVLEALRERGRMKANAPHLVKDQAFVISNYTYWDNFLYFCGLTLYDLLSFGFGYGRSRFIRVCYGKTINIFSASEIICIHRDDRLTRYCTTRGDYVQYITLTNALKNLPKVFVRVNSNCIINRQHVKHYSRSTVTLDNGEVVKIGRPYKEEVFS